jgi:alkylation response protein AidB-like acyl-CoA dehydrogenase
MNDVAEGLAEVAASTAGIFDDPIKGFGVLSDYARRRAALATGVRREKSRFSILHESLAVETSLFEDGVTQLAKAADRILRKYGKGIIGQQLVTRRLADIMIDLFGLAAVLSRVSTRIEDHGESAAASEREIVRAFARDAKRRIDRCFAGIDDNEDDEVRALARHVIELGRYPWDNV